MNNQLRFSREMSPLSSRLNAIDLYLVVCIFLVFSALMEYAVILLLLNRKRRPKYDINSAIKKMLHNGDLDSLGVTGQCVSHLLSYMRDLQTLFVTWFLDGDTLPT